MRESPEDAESVVFRSAVDYDVLEIRIPLVEDRLDGLGNVLALIERGRNDRDAWPVLHVKKSPGSNVAREPSFLETQAIPCVGLESSTSLLPKDHRLLNHQPS